MKKVTLIAMTLLCSVAFTDCAAKKPVQKQVEPEPQPVVQQESDTQRKIRELKEQQELLRLQHEMELENLKYQNQLATLESQQGMQQKLEGGVQLLITPCMDEFIALNKVADQMAAQGISTGQPTQELAQVVANERALTDIARRFAGVVKNAVEDYNKDTSTPQGNRVTEGELEGMAMSAGEQAINKFFIVGCRQFAKDRYNNYICYQALYVPMQKVMDAVLDEVQKVDVDKALFRKRMEAELKANAERENAALKQQKDEISKDE